METAWEKETDLWSVIRRPVSARGLCAILPSHAHHLGSRLVAPGVGAAGWGGGDHNNLDSQHPSSPPSPTLASMIAPLQRGSALPPARTINSHALSDRPGTRE